MTTWSRTTTLCFTIAAALLPLSSGCGGDRSGAAPTGAGAEQPRRAALAASVTGVVTDPGYQPIPEYHLNDATGTPDFLTFGPAGLALPESGTTSAAATALAFFRRYPKVFGTADVDASCRWWRRQSTARR